MKTKAEFQVYYEANGLEATISAFCEHIRKETKNIVSPAYSFAHIVLDDYNLGDDSILYCLSEGTIDRYRQYKIESKSFDHELLEYGITATKEFLEWLLDVPEQVRDEIGY